MNNRYLDGESDEDSYDSDEEIDIHEVVRSGTFQDVKEAIAMDRPRLIALKDEVSIYYFVDKIQHILTLHSRYYIFLSLDDAPYIMLPSSIKSK